MTEASSSSMDVNSGLPSHLLHDLASLKRGFSLNWNEIRNWCVMSFLSNYCFILLHLEAAETIKRLWSQPSNLINALCIFQPSCVIRNFYWQCILLDGVVVFLIGSRSLGFFDFYGIYKQSF